MFSLWKAYEELERLIETTKWWEFLWRRRLKITLDTLQYLASIKAFETALVDLEECGMLKRVKE